ncbi:maleylpyruvate isomerase family protein [Panacibacter ginsenosidivorans]|uniref:Maleylpyruvate isomerase family protein n=1 Tax=Panacibacter ginsenosidivorans TaxID=1813871 RepID=A0A5B8VBM2_9BACT|nr:maleylpyruvate isomerase N-terminal domain-containing protein [Panacibacter ginsenosidivorans]QEC67698.1 maleylpyruvate isomerase family protein [Panacibacter ginsenosidivorans]
MDKEVPIQTQHLFPVLDNKLMELLHSLTPEEWQAQTVAKLWKVKDVAAHLLDGNIRALSIQQEKYFGEIPPAITSYNDLVSWLNQLNADWVKAAKRISPSVMILLHEATGKQTCEYFASVDPFEKAIFAVSWAGEDESLNWMHIAREYTEKWLHQQQIRDAVNKQGIMTKELFYPFIDTFMYALPYTYKNVVAEEGTVIQVNINTEIGGIWYLIKDAAGWRLSKSVNHEIIAAITIDPDTAWKLFSKSLRAEDVMKNIAIAGDEKLAVVTLEMISVMA